MLTNEDSTIVFLKTGELAQRLIILVQTIPLEYGFNGAVGLKYEAIKDYVKWETPKGYNKQKEYVPILVNLGRYYANEISMQK